MQTPHRDLDVTKYSGVSIHDDVYTFPLWNLSGQLVGYQQYRPDAGKERLPNPRDMRYFTYLPKSTNTAWGLETLDPKKRVLFLVEGVFDAVKLHNAGFNALALLTNNPKPLKPWLHSLGYYLISVCEGDEAGKKLATVGHEAIYLPEGFDVGDMSSRCVKQFFQEIA